MLIFETAPDDPWTDDPPGSPPVAESPVTPVTTIPPVAEKVHPLVDGRVADVRKNITATDDLDTLRTMHASEKGRETPRATVLSAIEKRIAALGPMIPPITDGTPKTPPKAVRPPEPVASPIQAPAPTGKPTATFVSGSGREHRVEYETLSKMYVAAANAIKQCASPTKAALIELGGGKRVLVYELSDIVMSGCGDDKTNLRGMGQAG